MILHDHEIQYLAVMQQAEPYELFQEQFLGHRRPKKHLLVVDPNSHLVEHPRLDDSGCTHTQMTPPESTPPAVGMRNQFFWLVQLKLMTRDCTLGWAQVTKR